MTTALKTRTKVGALAAAAVSTGLPILALAPSASAASYYMSNSDTAVSRYCGTGTNRAVVKSKVKRLTSGRDEITLQVKQDKYGCTSVRVTMPPYLSAANSGAQWARPSSTQNEIRWQVQGFYGEDGSAKTLSDGRNYYETGWFRANQATQYIQYSNWGTMAIGITAW